MATSPAAPRSGGSTGDRLFGKARFTLLIVLLVLLILCVVFSWMTQGAMNLLHGRSGATGAGAKRALVGLRPWQTAQALAPLAVTAEENEYARQAERYADHEVDQAFAAALRQARLDAEHHPLTAEALSLKQKIAQLEQLKAQDEALVNGLMAQSAGGGKAAAGTSQTSSASGDLEVAKAQLGLDTDELADAQRDLQRASGDPSQAIQDELATHEESMRKYDSEVQDGGQIAVLSAKHDHTLASRIAAWWNQRSRRQLIEQAQQEAQSEVQTLTGEHGAVENRANAAAAAAAAPDRATELEDLHDRSTLRQILAIDDDRIQTEQQLAAVYGKWVAQVDLQHRIVLHMILDSLVVILLIVAGMLVCDGIARRIMERPAVDRRQMRTLRSVLTLSIQLLGVALVLLVIFGPPKETPTILGLATAALTIALQDYILAFLGWFFLVGKNGIHVGDWVEINSVSGEVIDIGLMTTTLLETGGMADPGYPTGRRISFMNGFAIRGQFFNFSTAGQWMWDEIDVGVPQSADMHTLMGEVQKTVAEETQENSQRAEQEWKQASHSESLGRLRAEPIVNLRPSGAGIDLQIRYVTSASARFDLRNRLYRRVVDLLHQRNAVA
jgi:small-conductance mechanosensitive channel